MSTYRGIMIVEPIPYRHTTSATCTIAHGLLAAAMCALLMSPIEAFATYTVECEGYDDESDEYVSGTCEDGNFSGTTDSGDSVSGDCEFDGDFSGTNDETGDSVSGECEGE